MFYYTEGVAIIIVMIVTISDTDILSAYIRKKIVSRTGRSLLPL
jgi:ABC-type phosphate/phosphonate transport system permease subunit